MSLDDSIKVSRLIQEWAEAVNEWQEAKNRRDSLLPELDAQIKTANAEIWSEDVSSKSREEQDRLSQRSYAIPAIQTKVSLVTRIDEKYANIRELHKRTVDILLPIAIRSEEARYVLQRLETDDVQSLICGDSPRVFSLLRSLAMPETVQSNIQPRTSEQVPRGNSDADRRTKARRGRPADESLNRAIVRVVKPYGSDWQSHLPEICKQLEADKVELFHSKKWDTMATWSAVESEDRAGLIKAIQHRLKWASEHHEPPNESSASNS